MTDDQGNTPDTPDSKEEDRPLLDRGDTVDRYTVIRLLGRGGMGEVYLARDTELGRKVALKILHRKGLGAADAVERFLFEARTTARFNHPHIVTIYGVGTVDEHPYVALEYLEGQTLHERMRSAPPVGWEVLRIGLAIAEALQEAQRHKILHRDLKPGNVMIPRDGRIRVVDFGLALRVDRGDVPELDTGESGHLSETLLQTSPELFQSSGTGIRGTPMYMSPEQWAERPTTGAADVWALGVMLWEMAAGKHPYAGRGLYELCGEVMSGAPVPELPGAVDPRLRELIARCVDKHPGERPPITEVVTTLGELVRGRSTRAIRERGPFRGLQACEERDAELFFGRDAEIDTFLERLRTEPVLPVVGASGAGKSSFVQAGVVPRLREGGTWRVLAMRPGRRPFRALAMRLAGGESSRGSRRSSSGLDTTRTTGAAREQIDAEEARLRAELMVSPGRLALHLGALAHDEGARVLLFVDQLEELVTLVDDDEERRAFLAAVCQAADDPEGPVRVVFTLRDDFLGRLAEGPEARDVLGRVTVLRTPGRGALEEILTRSAAAADHEFDDPDLAAAMAAEVDGEPAALPLLQVAGQLLWDRRDRKDRRLRRADYEAMGGVAGALAHHADGVLDALPPDQLALARTLLQRLVTPERTRRVVPRGELLDGLPEAAGDVLDRLVEGRLLQSRRARRGAGDAEVELVHESLIRSWVRFARWLDDDRDALAFLAEVGQAAALWEQRGRPDAEVWRGDALRDAALRAERLPHLPGEIDAFLRAGRAADQRGARRRRWLIAGVIAALVAVAVVLGLSQREAVRQRGVAEANEQRVIEREMESQRNLAAAYLEKADRLFDDRQPAEARIYAAAHLLHNPDNPRSPHHRSPRTGGAESHDDSMVQAYSLHQQAEFDTVIRPERRFQGGEGKVVAAFSPTGPLLATTSNEGPGGVTLWDTGSFEEIGVVPIPGAAATLGIAIAPNGTTIACAQDDQTVVLVDAMTREQIALFELTDPVSRVPALAFSPDGGLLVVGDARGRLHLWSTREQRMLESIAAHDHEVFALGFMADGTTVASASGDRVVRFWDMPSRARLFELPEHESWVMDVAISPDGRRIATVTEGGNTRLWDAETRELVHVFPEAGEALNIVEFTPDGRFLYTAGMEGRLRLWDVDTFAIRSLVRTKGSNWAGAMSHDGALIALQSYGESTVEMWRVSPRSRGLASANDKIVRLRYSHDGARLAFTSRDSAVRLIDRADGAVLQTVTHHEDWPWGIDFAPDGRTAASSGWDHTARIWNLEDGTCERTLRVHAEALKVAYSPDGKTLAVGGYKPPVVLFDVASGERIRTFPGSCGVTFSPDGELLAASNYPGTEIVVWEVETGAEVGRIKEQPARLYNLEFSPDGTLLASGDFEGNVFLWSTASWALVRELEGHTRWVNVVRFTRDGERVAAAGDDGLTRVWEVATGAPLLDYRSQAEAACVDFSPDGSEIALGDDMDVVIYPLDYSIRDRDPAELLREAEQAAGMALEGFTLVPAD